MTMWSRKAEECKPLDLRAAPPKYSLRTVLLQGVSREGILCAGGYVSIDHAYNNES